MTEVEAARLITMLITAFPDGMRFLGEQQQAETRLLYRTYLMDLPYDAGNAGVSRTIATARKWPSIGELRSIIGLYTNGRDPLGGEAWGRIRRMTGRYTEPAYAELDARLRQCLDSFGWIVWDTVWRGGEALRSWRVVIGGDSEASDRARWIELWDQTTMRDTQDRTAAAFAPAVRPRIGSAAPRQLAELLQPLLQAAKETK